MKSEKVSYSDIGGSFDDSIELWGSWGARKYEYTHNEHSYGYFRDNGDGNYDNIGLYGQ